MRRAPERPMFKVFCNGDFINDYGRIVLPNGWKSRKLFSKRAAYKLKVELELRGDITREQGVIVWIDIMECDFPETFDERMVDITIYWADFWIQKNTAHLN